MLNANDSERNFRWKCSEPIAWQRMHNAYELLREYVSFQIFPNYSKGNTWEYWKAFNTGYIKKSTTNVKKIDVK